MLGVDSLRRGLGRRISPGGISPRTRGRAPWPLLAGGLFVAGIALLPVGYLVIRALGADVEALDLVLRPRTMVVAASTVALALLVGAGTVAIGVPLAWLTTRTDLPGRRLWAVLVAVPLAIPSYVIGFAYLAAFGPRGALQGLLEPFGVGQFPSIGGLVGTTLVLVLAAYPYVLLSTRAALLRTDPSTEEAARLLGDRRRTLFRRVTLPILFPAIAAGALLAVLYALSDFGVVALFQFDSFSRAIYVQYRASFDRSLAAILALMLVALTLCVTWAEARLRRRAGAYEGVARASRRPSAVVPLGRWQWPALAFCGAIVVLALGVPTGTIVWWLVRGAAQGANIEVAVDGALNSFLVGAGAAIGSVLLVIPIGLLVARYPSRLTSLIERATFTGYALPGIVIALAVVFIATSTVPVLYQTIALLVGAYAIRFLPQTVGGVRSALEAYGPRLEEAGRTLGDGPIRVFVRLTVPFLRPSMVAGGALVFLTTVKELPMALLLGPIGFDTLATQIWDAASEGFYARAAGPASILLVLSIASVALLLRVEEGQR